MWKIVHSKYALVSLSLVTSYNMGRLQLQYLKNGNNFHFQLCIQDIRNRYQFKNIKSMVGLHSYNFVNLVYRRQETSRLQAILILPYKTFKNLFLVKHIYTYICKQIIISFYKCRNLKKYIFVFFWIIQNNSADSSFFVNFWFQEKNNLDDFKYCVSISLVQSFMFCFRKYSEEFNISIFFFFLDLKRNFFWKITIACSIKTFELSSIICWNNDFMIITVWGNEIQFKLHEFWR